MKRYQVGILLIVFLWSTTISAFEPVHFVSSPTRLNIDVDASLCVGGLRFDAYDTEDLPHLSAVPNYRVGLVPIAPGTEIWGTNISRLLTNQGFTEYMGRNYPNLRLYEVGEQYDLFREGALISDSRLYNMLVNSGSSDTSTEENLRDAMSLSGVSWTLPASEDNFEEVEVYPGGKKNIDIGSYFMDEMNRADGKALESVAQGFIPNTGFAKGETHFITCNPYTAVPVVYATDRYMDFHFKPIGTVFVKNGSNVVTQPGSEQACAVKFKHVDTSIQNIQSNLGFDGVTSLNIKADVRYTGEYRFDYMIDPPVIGGFANLPAQYTNFGMATMHDTEGNVHLVQSLPSLRNFFRWLPHTDHGYTNQKLLIKPAVFQKVFQDSVLWEFSHFEVTYPVPTLNEGVLFVSEETAKVEGVKFQEISMGEVAYFTFTNLPWLEGEPNTFYIESVDRPYMVEAVYEPGDLSPRGKEVVAESTRLTLNWAVTNEMKKLAAVKEREWGENWWNKGFPTYYNVKITGDGGYNRDIKKINPTQESVVVDELEPGKTYKWELETWASDDNGSGTQLSVWKSEPVSTIPLPNLVGHCASTSAIKLKTRVDDDGDEVWSIQLPMLYTLGSAQLAPFKFEASPGKRMTPIDLYSLSFVNVRSDNMTKMIVADIKIREFYNSFEKDESQRNVIHVHFLPQKVMVKAVAVDGLFKPIGAAIGGQIGSWWPAADGQLKESPIRLVQAPLMYKGNRLYRFKEWKWNGKIQAAKMPFVDPVNGVNILMVKVMGCQDDPDNPVIPTIYAVYEEIEVDCFSVAVEFAVNWNTIGYDFKVPISPSEGDCPNDTTRFMAGTKVSVGPVPAEIKHNDLKYRFVGWIVGDQVYPNTPKLALTMDSDKMILANYQPSQDRFQLIFYAVTGSKHARLDTKIFPDPDRDGLYQAGTMVEIGPVPKSLDEGLYVFVGWSVDGDMKPPTEDNQKIQITMDTSHKVTAVYQKTRRD
ncbi:MAG TPA: hypothetical protein PKV16_06350 [Caldisericia bacterium]|nr:hypothetical protein [Caldisericia bacterium]HPF49190.1 hypothetical protein [Caldisericia bacterium]HPI84131.1 hypothetical protein [Caldisericia bacterium]HPQ93388.1 hypothetical protein [Caldisericia bacterium]HRV75230.1 hypothetical protein [Caldisericia bacterium]